MPSTAYETGNTSKLLDQITSEFSGVHISTVNRKYFNEERGVLQCCFFIVVNFIAQFVLLQLLVVTLTVLQEYTVIQKSHGRSQECPSDWQCQNFAVVTGMGKQEWFGSHVVMVLCALIQYWHVDILWRMSCHSIVQSMYRGLSDDRVNSCYCWLSVWTACKTQWWTIEWLAVMSVFLCVGMQYIKSLCLPEYSTVELTVKSK